jgi:hypothetical protein
MALEEKMARQPIHFVEYDHRRLERELSWPGAALIAAVLVLATGWILWGQA